MNTWLVTTGSSDVRLTTDQLWDSWGECQFKPAKVRNLYSVPSRALGMVYQKHPDQVWPYLSFPLLKEFARQLQADGVNLSQIIFFTTDQQAIFSEQERDQGEKCPYWKDTCTLEPVFRRLFEQLYPGAVVVPKLIAPQDPQAGVDDWNAMLDLVADQLREVTASGIVYVSHQAGTPAISSALQFRTLAKFGRQVQFLIGNEYSSSKTRLINSPAYLRSLQLQEAKAMLRRHDYTGVRDLLGIGSQEEIAAPLEAAIQWNFANFDQFAQKIGRQPEWWRIGYEAAYLATVRLEQGSPTEAFFHGFRAVEGLMLTWASERFAAHIEEPKRSCPFLKQSILEELPNYLRAQGDKRDERRQRLRESLLGDGRIELSSFQLYELLREGQPEGQELCSDLETFENRIAPRRNLLFHRLRGLETKKLLEEWKVKTEQEWRDRLLRLLNFISGENFSSLEAASHLPAVHAQLGQMLEYL